MSSTIVSKKSKLLPLNLTSETVHEILKKQVPQKQSNKKIYPTAKYTTQQIRSTTDTNTHIIKKIKQMDRIYSEGKDLGREKQKQRLRPNFCNTDINRHKTQQICGFGDREVGVGQTYAVNSCVEIKNKSNNISNNYERQGKSQCSAEKYFEKIHKIKNLKLKQYMRNKFAIDIKTIETSRDENHSKQQIGNHQRQPKYKSKLMFKHQKDVTKKKEEEIINDLEQNENQQQKDNQPKNKNLIQMKLQKIMKKTQRLEKTHGTVKNFQFSRQTEQHPADVRFQRLINHLNLFLASYGCSANNSIKHLPLYTRNCHKFKYYVGSGNNKNLIVSVMKKRWWWVQTNSISEANFVWTQLKQLKFMENCQKFQNQPQVPLVITEKAPRKRQAQLQDQTKSKIFHTKSNLIQIDLPQIEKNSSQLKKWKTPQRIHNHYEGNSSLGNKKALFHYLSLYCDYKGVDRYNYIPLTFHITSQRSPEVKNLEKAIESSPNSYWIVKPGENSNRGNGISVLKSISDIKQQIRKLTNNTLIVQKYIDNLFLYCCRKFDIRTYMIAITIGGSTKFYWHAQGYLRTSSYIYNLKEHNNIFVHLTNDAIQATDGKYSKYEEGNKLSYQQFQRYLDQNYRNKGYDMKAVHGQMRNIAKLAVQATYPQLNISKLEYGFQVFGLDFILDADFKPWLIQINTNPCLELCSPCLQRLIPQMIENAIRLAVDTVFQPCVMFPRSMASNVPENILATNKFSIIFDDFFDRDLQWEKIVSSVTLKIEKDEQQQQQFVGDGELIITF